MAHPGIPYSLHLAQARKLQGLIMSKFLLLLLTDAHPLQIKHSALPSPLSPTAGCPRPPDSAFPAGLPVTCPVNVLDVSKRNRSSSPTQALLSTHSLALMAALDNQSPLQGQTSQIKPKCRSFREQSLSWKSRGI